MPTDNNDFDQQVMPQSLSAEKAALGSIILDDAGAVKHEIFATLVSGDFYRMDHRHIYDALLEMYEADESIDLVTLRDLLKRNSQWDNIGGVDYLTELVNTLPSPANGVHYANIVIRLSQAREVIGVCDEIREASRNSDSERVLQLVESKLLTVLSRSDDGYTTLARELPAAVKAAVAVEEIRPGIKTGYFDLDNIIELRKGEVTVIAARPSMGKSALAANIIESLITQDETAVAMFSLEMSATALTRRILYGRAKIDSLQINKHLLTEIDTDRLQDTADELSKAAVIIDQTTALTPLKLRSAAKRYVQHHNIKLIVIDYLQLMTGIGQNRAQEVGYISRRIKLLAVELDMPIILISQLNRGPENRENHRPRLSDLRESGDIEQDADIVLLLHREDYYHRDAVGYNATHVAEIDIAKQRNGPTGLISLIWDDMHVRFKSMSKAPEF